MCIDVKYDPDADVHVDGTTTTAADDVHVDGTTTTAADDVHVDDDLAEASADSLLAGVAPRTSPRVDPTGDVASRYQSRSEGESENEGEVEVCATSKPKPMPSEVVAMPTVPATAAATATEATAVAATATAPAAEVAEPSCDSVVAPAMASPARPPGSSTSDRLTVDEIRAARMDVCDAKGRYRSSLIFVLGGRPVLLSFSEVERLLPRGSLTSAAGSLDAALLSPRLAPCERQRRLLCSALRRHRRQLPSTQAVMSRGTSPPMSESDEAGPKPIFGARKLSFGRRAREGSPTGRDDGGGSSLRHKLGLTSLRSSSTQRVAEQPPCLCEGLVARALSEGHWRVEFARLSATHLAFSRPGSRRAPRLCVALVDIHEVVVVVWCCCCGAVCGARPYPRGGCCCVVLLLCCCCGARPYPRGCCCCVVLLLWCCVWRSSISTRLLLCGAVVVAL